MRRFALLAALLLSAGCSAPAAPAATAPAVDADLLPEPVSTISTISTERPVTVGTFANESYGWLIADGTRLFATTDGGRTWSHRATFDEPVRRLHFISEDRGWAFTEKVALATADGGGTWEPVSPESVSTRTQFLDEQFAWELEQKDGSSPSFLRLTLDGGQTWRSQPTPCKTGMMQARAASFVDRQTGFLLCGFFQGSGGSSKWLFSTADGGESWQLLTGTIYGAARDEFPPGVVVGPRDPLPKGALPISSGGVTMTFLDAGHGVISFANMGPYVGHTYSTADGGQTWTPLPVPGGLFTGGFRYFTPMFGRILVNDQQQWAWLETHDGGTSWESAYPPLSPLLPASP